MDQRVDLFIVAGEPSGDLLGARLLEKISHRKVEAVAGPKMREHPIQVFSEMEKLCSMGFFGIVSSLPRLIRQFFKIRNEILRVNPKVALFIDYPGFNLRIEKSLKKKGFSGKIIHYVCPSVWAWGKGRISLLEKNVDLLLCLFPFEKKCFSSKRLQVEYIGHPLTSKIEPKSTPRTNILAIFPGSRISEIKKNLIIQLNAAREILRHDPSAEIAISFSDEKKRELIEEIVKDFPCTLIPPKECYSLMERARVALATSGTVTLELALHKTPTIVNYAIGRLDQFLAQKIFRIRLPYYCIVNIIAEREVFPEFFGSNLEEKAFIRAVKKLWEFPGVVPTVLENCSSSPETFVERALS